MNKFYFDDPKELRNYANFSLLVASELFKRGEAPSIDMLRDYTAYCLTFGTLPKSYEEIEETLLKAHDKGDKNTVEKFTEHAFKVQKAIYKLAGGVGEVGEKEISLPYEEPAKRIPLGYAILAAFAIVGGIAAGAYAYSHDYFDKVLEWFKKPKKKDKSVLTNISFPTHSQEQEQPQIPQEQINLEKLAQSIGVPLSVAKQIENSLSQEQAIAFIQELKDFNKSYAPADIADLLPEDYQQKVYENIAKKITFEITKDGKFTEKERKALEFLKELDAEVIKWYAFEKGIDEKTIEYLSYLSSSKNQTLARYAAENLLFFEDKKLSEEEKKVLENPKEKKLIEKIKKSYAKLLEKIHGLKKQIKELPEYKQNNLQTLEALEDIAFLASRAEPYERFEDRFNQEKITPAREVYEAFELMVEKGKVPKNIVPYEIPEYNVQLYMLWKLAEDAEFKKHDTLALSVAMNEGFPYLIGNKDVKKMVIEDCRKWLKFLRETAEWQKAKFRFNLEEYPLEAKVMLSMRNVKYIDTKNAYPSSPEIKTFPEFFNYPYFNPKLKPIDVETYKWFWIDEFGNLHKLRKKMLKILPAYIRSKTDGEIGKDFDKILHKKTYWKYTYPEYSKARVYGIEKYKEKLKEKLITVDGRRTVSFWIFNPDFEVRYFLNNSRGIGICPDYECFAKSLSKAFGISETKVKVFMKGNVAIGHTFPSYYDSIRKKWKVADILHGKLIDKQIKISKCNKVKKYLQLPPLHLKKILENPKNMYISQEIDTSTCKKEMRSGYPCETMKKIILYEFEHVNLTHLYSK